MRGLRFARNRVHHQYADALWLDRRGMVLPTTLPTQFFEWRWREDLPPGKDNRNREAYEAHLGGQPARFTLDVVGERLAGLT